MPRDSGLLPPISRALLRAARAGCIHIRQGARAADDEEKNITDSEDPAAASNMADRSFTTRKWMALPKHLEPAEVEFLAKRRPGLPSLYGAAAGIDGSSANSGPMRRTKFKKIDPETGNISIYEAWVPEGHRIEGEITGDVQAIVDQSEVPVNPEAPAPGTIVEGVGIVNSEGVVVAEAGSAAVMTPPKRRPPPPKRKGRGIGKGRKKKVMFAPGEGADAATVHGVGPGAGSNGTGLDGESQQDASQMSMGQDEDEEDADDGDESDDADESMMDAKTPDTPQPPSGAESADAASLETPAGQPADADVEMTDDVPEGQPAPVPSLPAGNDTLSQQPTETETSQPQKASEADASALASSVPTKVEPQDVDEKPTISDTDKEVTTTNETAVETGEAEPQGDETDPELKPKLSPKDESDSTSQEKTQVLQSPSADAENSHSTSGEQGVTQSQQPEQSAGGVAESEQAPVSSSVSVDPQAPKEGLGEPIDEPGTQEPSKSADNDQPDSDAPVTNVDPAEANQGATTDASALEQTTVPAPQSPTHPDSSLQSPLTPEDPQPEQETTIKSPVLSPPPAADPPSTEEPTSVPNEKTEATVYGASEQKEDSLPDSTPKSGPTDSV